MYFISPVSAIQLHFSPFSHIYEIEDRADEEVLQATSVISRRRTIYWRTADLSAWEGHQRTIGR